MTTEQDIAPHRSRGRPRTFDREAALKSALGVFWKRGFEPASMAELCSEMGINPPSLYAAFGNKAKLFMEAVDYYETTYWDGAWKALCASPDLHQGIGDFFHEAAHILSSQDAPCGCLVVLGATNVCQDSECIHDALRALRKRGRDCFRERLDRAVSEGQLPADFDTSGLATTLKTTLEGMSLQARDGAEQAELELIAPFVLRMLPRPA